MFLLLYMENDGRRKDDPIKLINPIDDTESVLLLTEKIQRFTSDDRSEIFVLKIQELVTGIFYIGILRYKKDLDLGYQTLKIYAEGKQTQIQFNGEFETEYYTATVISGIFDLEKFNSIFFRLKMNSKKFIYSIGAEDVKFSELVERAFVKVSK